MRPEMGEPPPTSPPSSLLQEPLLKKLSAASIASHGAGKEELSAEPRLSSAACKVCTISSTLLMTAVSLGALSGVGKLVMRQHLQLRAASNRPWAQTEAALLIGAELTGVLILAFLAAFIPSMIMTWTTAVVLSIPSYIFGSRATKSSTFQRFVEDGTHMARDIYASTTQQLHTRFNFVVVSTLGFALLSLLASQDDRATTAGQH